jgi:hypothetical protein
VLAIQVVTVTWTKASRGGTAAVQRNQIPRAFMLRSHGGSLNVIQRHAFKEIAAGEFESRAITIGQAPSPPTNIEGLLLDEVNNEVVIGFSWNGNVHGMPNRGVMRRLAVLASDENAQIRVNGRHSAEAQWYTQHTFNVAFGAKVAENAFVDRLFTHVISLEDNLF